MSRKIIGGTVGTPHNPKKIIEQTKVDEDIRKLSEDKADKATTYTKTEVDEKLQNLPSGGGGTDLDVQINGKSIVKEGVANIPIANGSEVGLVRNYYNEYSSGIKFDSDGAIRLVNTIDNISKRTNNFPILNTSLDYAVKCAMTDGKGAEWTEEEKVSARERIGTLSNFRLLGEVNITEEVAEVSFDGFEVDDIYVYTKGLKTNKTSSVGCFLRFNDTESDGTLRNAMYTSNVFNAITSQEGFALVSEISNGYKFKISTPKPDMDLNAKEMKTFGSLCEQVGKITKVTLMSSEATSYPFSGGLIRLFGR